MYYAGGRASTKRSDSPLITSSIWPDIEPNYGVSNYADAHVGHESVHGYHGHKIYLQYDEDGVMVDDEDGESYI